MPTGLETFSSHLPGGQGLRQVIKRKLTKTCPEQAAFESCLSEGQAGIKVFFSPARLACENSRPSSHPTRVAFCEKESFLRNATWAGSGEGRLFSQATARYAIKFDLHMFCF